LNRECLYEYCCRRSSFDKSSKKSYDESITTADSVSTEDLTDKINDDDDIDELSKHVSGVSILSQ